MQDMQDNFV